MRYAVYSGSIIDEVVFLKGRPPLAEYLSFVSQNDVEGASFAAGDLATEWREANERIRELEATEAGTADSPIIEPLPPSLQSRAVRFLNAPIIKRSFGLVPFDLGMIDLDHLVVFQKQINLGFVSQLGSQIAGLRTDEDLFDFTLPLDRPRPPIKTARIGPSAFAFTSPSMDFRALDVALLDPTKLTGYEVGGWLSGLAGLAFGYGPNIVQAVSYKNRLILGNGSHRAYALREAGRAKVPALISKASSDEEMAMLIPVIAQKPAPYVDAARPPLLKDYFDEPLRRIVRMPRKVRQVRILIQSEQTDAPG